MKFPERINAPWIDSLSDVDLVTAEWELRASFSKEEKAERRRRGDAYDVLRGPESLTSAWMRWSMVNAATRDRGLRAKR
jgi:hypothetical protein